MKTITELDAAIIAEEKGWDYLPACDEGFAAVDEFGDTAPRDLPAQAVSAPKINKRRLRQKLVRDIMPRVKEEEDSQALQWWMVNEEEFAPLLAGKTDDEIHDYTLGVIRFCEWACFRLGGY